MSERHDNPGKEGTGALVGGQAVIEGVMMRGPDAWAVAYREPLPEQLTPEGVAARELPRGGIAVERFPLESVLHRHRLLRLPLVRGVVALGESLRLGFRALNLSANAQLPQGERQISDGLWVGTVALALALGVGLFFLVPAGLTKLAGVGGDSASGGLAFVVVEKLVRVGVFLGYIALVSRMGHLQRVFQYHGAEHKTIACHEAGLPLTPANARGMSRLHPRCGTSFLLLVMLVAVVVFAPLGELAWPWLVLSRVVGIPLIAGLAYEALRGFARHGDSAWGRALVWPGLQLQRLTTREPDDDQLEVAIVALRAAVAEEDEGIEGEGRADAPLAA